MPNSTATGRSRYDTGVVDKDGHETTSDASGNITDLNGNPVDTSKTYTPPPPPSQPEPSSTSSSSSTDNPHFGSEPDSTPDGGGGFMDFITSIFSNCRQS